jgi:hypothetical protein
MLRAHAIADYAGKIVNEVSPAGRIRHSLDSRIGAGI